jgi:hypothetical protein
MIKLIRLENKTDE